METESADARWYTPLEKFDQQVSSNSEAAIFRCRKRVCCGVKG